MTTFAEQLRVQKSEKPDILELAPENLLHDGEVMCWLDLKDVSHQDLDELFFKEIIGIKLNYTLIKKFQLNPSFYVPVTKRSGKFQGVCIWFECTFPSADSSSPVTLSTNPNCPQTHWKQTVIILPKSTVIEVEEREPVAFHLTMKRNEVNARRWENTFSRIFSSIQL